MYFRTAQNRTQEAQTPGVDYIPPDYSGTAINSEAKQERDRTAPVNTSGREPRYPLMFGEDGSDNAGEGGSDHLYGSDTEHVKTKKRRSLEAEDLLLAGLIMLLLNEHSDDDVILMLGFLLIVGL